MLRDDALATRDRGDLATLELEGRQAAGAGDRRLITTSRSTSPAVLTGCLPSKCRPHAINALVGRHF
jgi:hypothetical protein